MIFVQTTTIMMTTTTTTVIQTDYFIPCTCMWDNNPSDKQTICIHDVSFKKAWSQTLQLGGLGVENGIMPDLHYSCISMVGLKYTTMMYNHISFQIY